MERGNGARLRGYGRDGRAPDPDGGVSGPPHRRRGASHGDSGAAADNRMLGTPFDPGGVRLARLVESLAIVKALLAGERASATGTHYAVADAAISPGAVQQPRPPILVAGSGPRLLALAAREAEI